MKTMVRAFLLAALFAVVPVVAQGAGTVVLTSSDWVPGQNVVIYTYTMTSDAAVSAGTFPATQTNDINGFIIRVETNPGAAPPTDLYDLTLVDADGLDVMGGVLADRSSTVTQHAVYPQVYVRGPVTITVANNSENSAVIVLRITVLR